MKNIEALKDLIETKMDEAVQHLAYTSHAFRLGHTQNACFSMVKVLQVMQEIMNLQQQLLLQMNVTSK